MAATDWITALQRTGEIELDARGSLRPQGRALELFRWLDGQFQSMALEAGARLFAVPATIQRGTLERGGYFESFADVAVPADAGTSAFLTPAACYHVYADLAGGGLTSPQLVTLAAPCARADERSPTDPGRLTRFRMREIVIIGDAAWVAANRDAWIARVTGFAGALGLVSSVEAATDTFFGGLGRGRRLIQQLKNLKYELRMDAGVGGRIAAASFNLHESFFAERFDIRLADGGPAASGCVAFGIERWMLACLAQLGPSRAIELTSGGVPRSTMNT
jgi:hypothetical protein